MSVVVQRRPADTLSSDEIARWHEMPAAIVVDVSDAVCQVDPAIRPLCPPGRQPRLFGRAVTARCEPPDFGAVLYALDLLQPGDVLVIAADGHTATAKPSTWPVKNQTAALWARG
jgi:4-hydroxy-4-methyl-2-oxoglutarate aldolase